MKKFALLALLFAVCLWAADFWQSKPFTDWSDKDAQKIIHTSPWARQVTVSLGSGVSAGGRGGRRRGGSSGMGEITPAGGAVGGGDDNTGGIAGRGGDDYGMGGAPAITVALTWESALPIRQARMRLKYGAEAGTTPAAKNFLEQDPGAYVIAVVGPMIRPFGGGRGDPSKDDPAAEEMKKAVMDQTSLSVKGKDAIKPNKLEAGRGSALFFFPKTAPFTLDDKEVEFSTKVGTLMIKQKFRLKDMVFNGKLEL